MFLTQKTIANKQTALEKLDVISQTILENSKFVVSELVFGSDEQDIECKNRNCFESIVGAVS